MEKNMEYDMETGIIMADLGKMGSRGYWESIG